LSDYAGLDLNDSKYSITSDYGTALGLVSTGASCSIDTI